MNTFIAPVEVSYADYGGEKISDLDPIINALRELDELYNRSPLLKAIFTDGSWMRPVNEDRPFCYRLEARRDEAETQINFHASFQRDNTLYGVVSGLGYEEDYEVFDIKDPALDIHSDGSYAAKLKATSSGLIYVAFGLGDEFDMDSHVPRYPVFDGEPTPESLRNRVVELLEPIHIPS